MNVRVRVRFCVPVGLGPMGELPTLDSVLAAIKAEELGVRKSDGIHDIPVPITRTKDVYHASSLWPVGPFRGHMFTMPRTMDQERALLHTGHRINTSNGPGLARSTPVRTIVMRQGEWRAQTDDIDELGRLLAHVHRIGSARKLGLGRLIGASVQEADEDESILDHRGLLRRPVPVTAAAEFGLDPARGSTHRAIIIDTGYKAPYWYRPWQARCLMPIPPLMVEGV